MNQTYKDNILAIARHHRAYCEGEKCTISLVLLMIVATVAGIEFSEEEIRVFL